MDGNKKSWDNMAGSTVLLELASQGASNLEIEEIMSRYTLVATMDDMANGAWINARDDEDASMQAIEVILDKATDSNLWSRGLIELRDIEGRLIRSMGAK